MLNDYYYNVNSGGSGKGEYPALAPIQFGCKLWPPSNKEIDVRYGATLISPSRMSGSATEYRDHWEAR